MERRAERVNAPVSASKLSRHVTGVITDPARLVNFSTKTRPRPDLKHCSWTQTCCHGMLSTAFTSMLRPWHARSAIRRPGHPRGQDADAVRVNRLLDAVVEHIIFVDGAQVNGADGQRLVRERIKLVVLIFFAFLVSPLPVSALAVFVFAVSPSLSSPFFWG